MSVIEHDFGIKKRQTVRRFTSLLGLEALHEANVRENPLPYLERASERIYQLETVIFEAASAATSDASDPASLETVEISKADYDRLLRCVAVLERALTDVISGADDM